MLDRGLRISTRTLAWITLGHACFFSSPLFAANDPFCKSSNEKVARAAAPASAGPGTGDFVSSASREERRKALQEALARRFPGIRSYLEGAETAVLVTSAESGELKIVKHPLQLETIAETIRWKAAMQREKALYEKMAKDAELESFLKYFSLIKEIDEIDGMPFVVVEPAKNGSLYQNLRPRATSVLNTATTVNQLLSGMTDLAKGAEALHRQKLVHYDIKPGNIGVIKEGQDGGFRLIYVDQGLLTPEGEWPPGFAPGAGTKEYSLPDRDKRPAGVKDDLYALGKVYTEMLAATLDRAPAEMPADVGGDPKKLRAWLNEGMARQKLSLLARKLEANQISTAKQLIEELAEIEKTVNP